MEKFDLYSDYLDGNLNDSQEKELLYELSSSDELRAEFRQLIAVNRSGSQVAKGYYVPDSSTSKIFAGVGIAGAVAPTGAVGLLHVLKSSPLLMPVAVSIITAISIFSFADIAGYRFTKDDGVQHKVPVTTSVSVSNGLAGSKLIDEIKTVENDNTTNQRNKDFDKNSVKNNKYNNDLAGNRNHSDIIDNEINVNSEKNIYNLNNSEIDYSRQNYNISSNRTESVNTNLNSAHYQPLAFNIEESDIPLSIEVRNSQYWNIPAATITPSRFADFHNMAIDMNYNFKNGISVGADIRRETFFQKFDFVDELNQYTIIEQQPNFTTLSLNLAYNYDTGGSVIPFAQVSVGGNVVGAVSRLMAGASYRISDNFMLNISGEYSNMTYSYKSTIFNSPKFGFNYGISYKF